MDSRTPAESRELVDCAHASLWHWRYAGTRTNEQRGEWMVSHAYAMVANGDEALRHAQQCLELTETEELAGFDLGYAYEAMWRALTLTRDPAATQWRAKAEAIAESIEDEEDRAIFVADLSV